MKGFDCGSANTVCHSIYVRLKKVRLIIIQKPLISAIFSVFDLTITQWDVYAFFKLSAIAK